MRTRFLLILLLCLAATGGAASAKEAAKRAHRTSLTASHKSKHAKLKSKKKCHSVSKARKRKQKTAKEAAACHVRAKKRAAKKSTKGKSSTAVKSTPTSPNATSTTVDASLEGMSVSGKHAPVDTAVPTLSGTTTQGSALTTSTGSWKYSPTSYTYRWNRCGKTGSNCTTISSTTRQSYTLQSADIGHTLEAVVTATNSSGAASSTSRHSSVVTAVSTSSPTSGGPTTGSTGTSAPANTVTPVVIGSAVQGQTLNAGVGTWTGAPSAYTYQWQRCGGSSCSNVSGSTSSTYVVGAGDVGDTVKARVTASNSVGSASATSAPTSTVMAIGPTSNASCAGVTGSDAIDQLALDACGFPSMDTTGPRSGTTYTSTYPNGLTISQPGTYSNMNVTGPINVTASNVIIQDSQVTDPDNSNPAIIVANGASGVQISYTSIHGTSNNGSGALFAAVENLYGNTLNSVTMDHDQFYNGDRILVGYGTVTNSYCLGGATFGSEHDECVYTSGAAPGINLTHDTLLNANPYQTASVFVDSPTGCAGCTNGSGSITIEDSILGGGDYCIYGGDGGDGSVHNGPETIEDNRFSLLYFPTCGQFGTDAYMAPDAVWSGNVWDDTGQTIPSP